MTVLHSPSPASNQTSGIPKAPCPINCIKNGIPGQETDSGAPDQPGQAELMDNTPGMSREVPCSALKGETVPDSLPATPKSPPTRRVPPMGTPRVPAPLPLSPQENHCYRLEPGGLQSMGSLRVGHDLASPGMPHLLFPCSAAGAGKDGATGDSRGERSPWLPLETRPDSPGVLSSFSPPPQHGPHKRLKTHCYD